MDGRELLFNLSFMSYNEVLKKLPRFTEVLNFPINCLRAIIPPKAEEHKIFEYSKNTKKNFSILVYPMISSLPTKYYPIHKPILCITKIRSSLFCRKGFVSSKNLNCYTLSENKSYSQEVYNFLAVSECLS
jgi:hypothetical protein